MIDLQKKYDKLLIALTFIVFMAFCIGGIFHYRSDSIFNLLVLLKTNFIGKETLLQNYNNLKLFTLKENPLPDRVIIGKNGWMFLGDYFEKGNSISLGRIRYSNYDLANISRNILSKKAFLDAANIKFYVAIAPNKQSIYDNYLPDGKYDPQNCTQQLIKYMALNHSFNIIDLRECLINIKDSTLLYYKTDTHWNDLGAFLGFNQICSTLKVDFGEKIPSFNINDFSIEKTIPETLDLSKLLKVDCKEEKIILHPNFVPTGKRINSCLKVPYYWNLGENQFEYRFMNEHRKLKILVFRDSFSSALLEYFKEGFYMSVLIWDSYFDKEIILKEKPDIVLYVVAERLINNAFNK